MPVETAPKAKRAPKRGQAKGSASSSIPPRPRPSSEGENEKPMPVNGEEAFGGPDIPEPKPVPEPKVKAKANPVVKARLDKLENEKKLLLTKDKWEEKVKQLNSEVTASLEAAKPYAQTQGLLSQKSYSTFFFLHHFVWVCGFFLSHQNLNEESKDYETLVV